MTNNNTSALPSANRTPDMPTDDEVCAPQDRIDLEQNGLKTLLM
jgi:hypothetical protein